MSNIRATVIIQGDVQGVGYRNFVRRTSRKFKVTGYVKNLEDSDVQVVCEGERPTAEAFIQAIQKCPPPISVESAEVKFSEPTGEFARFRIQTGDLAQEMLEGFETGASYLNLLGQHLTREIRAGNESLKQEIHSGNERLAGEIRQGNDSLKAEIRSGNKSLTEEIRSGNEGIKNEIRGLREETRTSFIFLAERYGEISKTMARIFEELKKERKQNHEDMKKLIASTACRVASGSGSRESRRR